MMNQKLYLFGLFVAIFCNLNAQNPNTIRTSHWVYGEGNHVHFQNGEPTLLDGADLDGHEAASAISNTNGDLLFYSDGQAVWQADGDTMPNGFDLIGHGSTANGSTIVPLPNNDNVFYVFHMPYAAFDDYLEDNYNYYSIVDMNLENGQGDVIEKNIPFQQYASESLAITQHANGMDF